MPWMDCTHPGYVKESTFKYADAVSEDMIADTCKHCGRPIKKLRLVDEDRLAGGM